MWLFTLQGGFVMPEQGPWPEAPYERQPAGRDQAAVGPPYRLPLPGQPAALSYDPADEAMAPLHARMLTEAGRQPARGESWVGHVTAWWCGPWGLGGTPQGWRRVAPCLALVSCEGELVRVFGWDAISDWCAIVGKATSEGAGALIDVHLRTATDPAGEHWWWVVDRLSPDGEIPSEGIPNG